MAEYESEVGAALGPDAQEWKCASPGPGTLRLAARAYHTWGLGCCSLAQLAAWYAVAGPQPTFARFCEDCAPEYRAAMTARHRCRRAELEQRHPALGRLGLRYPQAG